VCVCGVIEGVACLLEWNLSAIVSQGSQQLQRQNVSSPGRLLLQCLNILSDYQFYINLH